MITYFAERLILKFRILLTLFLLITASVNLTYAQSTCPINIDFGLGSFQNWQAYRGTVAAVGINNVITVNASAPINNIHTIIPKGTLKDPYGNFPISPPDGGAYSVKLGNDGTSNQAERISYEFTVPPNQTDFVITYQYAVVLQDPGHDVFEQPRFTAKVFDVTANTYITCGSFDYVATSGIPGFKPGGSQTVYKDWTPVSINLYGYQGHQLRLEFTTADCTRSGHFGYAYIDVNNTCSKLIKGSDYCPSQLTAILQGPPGFDKYNWYSADRSTLLGTGQNLILPTNGADGKTVQLDMIPFAGFGCNYTTSATMHALADINFSVTSPPVVCFPLKVNLTNMLVTQGSDANLTYTYWTDAAATTSLTTPNAVATTGTYYIKATAPTGCYDIKAVNVLINPLPTLNITNPATLCLGAPVNITSANITAGSSSGITLSYWTNATATTPLASPTSILTAGTYYIKATNANGCETIKPVTVTFYPPPTLVITNPAPFCLPQSVDITASAITAGSNSNITLSYWADASATTPLSAPNRIMVSGTYYIKATDINGCETIKPVFVVANPLPNLIINQPADACLPERVNITSAAITSGSSNIIQLTYWRDANATIPLTNPSMITDSGTYYIKAISPLGCELTQPITVVIHSLPKLIINDPAKVYMPNKIDLTQSAVTAGSTTGLNFTYWNDAAATYSLSSPISVDQSGTYYIKGTNIYGCYEIKPVNIVVTPVAQIMVPTAFTPTQFDNNMLHPFLVGIKIFNYFKVYNHWGVLVYETKSQDKDKGWNGVYKGQVQFMDTFTWYAEGIDFLDKVVRKSGNTLLLK